MTANVTLPASNATNNEKNRTRSAQKYHAIVEAAEQVFIEQGFQKTSMDNIAQVAKVSKRTVYNHFDNKNELFQHILKSCCDELYVSTELTYQADQPLHDQLLKMLDKQWDILTSDRIVKISRIVIAEYVTTPKFIQQFIEQVECMEKGIETWIRQALADHRLVDVEAEFAYEFLNNTIKAFAHDPLLFDQPRPDAEKKAFILNEIISLFLLRYENR